MVGASTAFRLGSGADASRLMRGAAFARKVGEINAAEGRIWKIGAGCGSGAAVDLTQGQEQQPKSDAVESYWAGGGEKGRGARPVPATPRLTRTPSTRVKAKKMTHRLCQPCPLPPPVSVPA